MPNYYKPKKVRLNDAQKKEEKKRYLFATGQKGFGLLRRKSERSVRTLRTAISCSRLQTQDAAKTSGGLCPLYK
jgi:hypothetical protein